MGNRMKRKLRSDRGASMLLALLLFLVCAVAGSVILASGTAAAGRMSELAEMDQRYYAVASAAEALRSQISKGISFTVTYELPVSLDEEENLVVDEEDPGISISGTGTDFWKNKTYDLLNHMYDGDPMSWKHQSDGDTGYAETFVLTLTGLSEVTPPPAVNVSVSGTPEMWSFTLENVPTEDDKEVFRLYLSCAGKVETAGPDLIENEDGIPQAYRTVHKVTWSIVEPGVSSMAPS